MSRYDPQRHHRRSIRLKGYDYTRPGAYFITMCTHQRAHLFGEVVNGVMHLNALGEIVRAEWFRSADIRREIVLYPDEFVIMPNHIHGIVWIVNVDDDGDDPASGATGPQHHHRDSNRFRGGATGTQHHDRDSNRFRGGATGTQHHDRDSNRFRGGATGRSPLPNASTTPNAPTTPGAPGEYPPRGPAPRSLGAFVAGFKSAATRAINAHRHTPGARVWQRNYHDRIIRNDAMLRAIRQYIRNNPKRWHEDRFHTPNPR